MEPDPAPGNLDKSAYTTPRSNSDRPGIVRRESIARPIRRLSPDMVKESAPFITACLLPLLLPFKARDTFAVCIFLGSAFLFCPFVDTSSLPQSLQSRLPAFSLQGAPSLFTTFFFTTLALNFFTNLDWLAILLGVLPLVGFAVAVAFQRVPRIFDQEKRYEYTTHVVGSAAICQESLVVLYHALAQLYSDGFADWNNNVNDQILSILARYFKALQPPFEVLSSLFTPAYMALPVGLLLALEHYLQSMFPSVPWRLLQLPIVAVSPSGRAVWFAQLLSFGFSSDLGFLISLVVFILLILLTGSPSLLCVLLLTRSLAFLSFHPGCFILGCVLLFFVHYRGDQLLLLKSHLTNSDSLSVAGTSLRSRVSLTVPANTKVTVAVDAGRISRLILSASSGEIVFGGACGRGSRGMMCQFLRSNIDLVNGNSANLSPEVENDAALRNVLGNQHLFTCSSLSPSQVTLINDTWLNVKCDHNFDRLLMICASAHVTTDYLVTHLAGARPVDAELELLTLELCHAWGVAKAHVRSSEEQTLAMLRLTPQDMLEVPCVLGLLGLVSLAAQLLCRNPVFFVLLVLTGVAGFIETLALKEDGSFENQRSCAFRVCASLVFGLNALVGGWWPLVTMPMFAVANAGFHLALSKFGRKDKTNGYGLVSVFVQLGVLVLLLLWGRFMGFGGKLPIFVELAALISFVILVLH